MKETSVEIPRSIIGNSSIEGKSKLHKN